MYDGRNSLHGAGDAQAAPGGGAAMVLPQPVPGLKGSLPLRRVHAFVIRQRRVARKRRTASERPEKIPHSV
jgi:hypothetical protein